MNIHLPLLSLNCCYNFSWFLWGIWNYIYERLMGSLPGYYYCLCLLNFKIAVLHFWSLAQRLMFRMWPAEGSGSGPESSQQRDLGSHTIGNSIHQEPDMEKAKIFVQFLCWSCCILELGDSVSRSQSLSVCATFFFKCLITPIYKGWKSNPLITKLF